MMATIFNVVSIAFIGSAAICRILIAIILMIVLYDTLRD